jgi:hypothetical protein
LQVILQLLMLQREPCMRLCRRLHLLLLLLWL